MGKTTIGKMMGAPQRLAETASHQDFEFDYNHNVVYFKGKSIHLSPHEADILQVLLNNRSRATPLGVLIQQVYGSAEPETAAVSIRVSVHSLRKKLVDTGIKIKAEPRVGYEIDAAAVPGLNRRLSDKILLALNTAKASGERELVTMLQAAYDLAEARRRQWLAARNATGQNTTSPRETDPPAKSEIVPDA
jgi:DNA-binding winged helix-turn-helix (wHTH) protein